MFYAVLTSCCQKSLDTVAKSKLMLLCPKLLPIMPALCSMPACTYYASNYASILGSGLLGGGGGPGSPTFYVLEKKKSKKLQNSWQVSREINSHSQSVFKV